MFNSLIKSEQNRNRLYLAVGFGIMTLALLLRLVGISEESVTGDEIFSITTAQAPFVALLQIVQEDLVHPPLYYLPLKGWLLIPSSNLVLQSRMLSILISLLLIALTALFTQSLFKSRSVTLLTALLLAVSPLQVFYSQHVRSYELFSLVTLLAAYAFLQVVQHQKSSTWIGVLCLSAIILPYIHYIGTLYLLLLSAIAFFKSKKVGLKVVAALTPGALLFTVWVAYVFPIYLAKRGLSSNLNWVSKPSVISLLTIYNDYVGELHFSHSGILLLLVNVILVIAYCAKLFFSPTPIEEQKTQYLLPLLLGTIPPILLFTVSNPPIGLPIWGTRHLMPCHAFFAIVLAQGALYFSHNRRWLVAIAILAFNFSGHHLLSPQHRRIPYKKITAFAEEIACRTEQKTLPILHSADWSVGLPVKYYSHDCCPINSLSELESEGTKAPSTFVLLYRPNVQSEHAALEQLKHQGYREQLGQYFSSSEENKWGTRVVLLNHEHSSKTPL